MTGVLIRREKLKKKKKEEKNYVKTGKIPCDTGAETRLMQLQAGEHRELTATTRRQEEARKDSGFHLESQREHGPADTSISDFWPPEVGPKNLLFF